MKWCDDTSGKHYNRTNKDGKFKYEKLYRYTINIITLFRLNTIGENPNLQKEAQYLFT